MIEELVLSLPALLIALKPCRETTYFQGWPELYICTVYLVNSLPKRLYIHRMYKVLANPTCFVTIILYRHVPEWQSLR